MLKFLLLFVFAFGTENVALTINGHPYLKHNFFAKYPKKQWERADSLQKTKMLDDFINRELCVLEAKQIGLQNDPEHAIKIYNKSLQILINESYEYFVAKPLISETELNKARINAKKEVFVSHILIGHSSAQLRQPPSRTLDEALMLSQKIKQEYDENGSFILLAEKYSDDPGVNENSGEVGWVPWGATVKDFQDMAFSLKPGVLSNPVLTEFGYHLILVTDSRPSDYNYMEGQEYENLIFNISKNSIRNKLRPAAIEYDKKMMEDFNVFFNNEDIKMIFNNYKKQKKLSDTSLNFLDNTISNLVLCVYNNKGFGPKWFARKLERSTSFRQLNFNTIDDMLSVFKTIILQDIAINKAFQNNITNMFSYNWKVDDMVAGLLYDAYLKNLINSASSLIDSNNIKKYYEDNKNTKYIEEEKLVIEEIKVFNKSIADSLLLVFNSNNTFSYKNNAGKELKTLQGPFSKKQNKKYFDIASKLNLNEISAVFSSTNSSFSIIKLVDKTINKPVSFDKVVMQIESLLIKEKQDYLKQEGIQMLYDKYNVIINNLSF